MRKLLFLLAAIVPFFFASCEKEEDPVLTISQTSIEAPADGSSTTITVVSNNPWSVKASDWCTVSPSGGQIGETQVTITVKQNDTYNSRECQITFSSLELTQTITVKQDENLGVVLPQEEYNISSDAQQLEIKVKANVPYNVNTTADWVKYAGTKALETATLLFNIEPNDTYDSREALINIIEDGTTDTTKIEIIQVPVDAIILSPKEYDLSSGEHTLELKLQTNVELEVVIPDNGKEWISHVETKALQEKTLVMKVASNDNHEARECEIIIKKKNGTTQEAVTIRQAQKDAIVLSEKEYNLSHGSHKIDIKLQSNVDILYEISQNATDWISIIETKALEDKTLSVEVKENKTFDKREGNIYVKMRDGNLNDTIKISQSNIDTLYLNNKTFSVAKTGGNIEITVNSTTQYTVEILADWIKEIESKALNTKKHTFEIAANQEQQSRNGYIAFRSNTTGQKDTATVVQTGSAVYVWVNGITPSSSVAGSGTENDPYIIHSANDLQWLIDQAGASTKDDIKTKGKYYRLTHDLEIDSDQGRGWTPIGMGIDDNNGEINTGNAFAGHFDGGGYSITGKMVPVSQLSNSGNVYFGFFGFCKAVRYPNNDNEFEYIPTIRNLNMSAAVDMKGIHTEFKNAHIGTVVGYSWGEVEIANSRNSGTITGFDATGNDKSTYMAGIVGSSYNLTITDCENTGEIKGGTLSGQWAGCWTAGVVAKANDIIAKNVSNKGKIYGATATTVWTAGVIGETSVRLMENVNNYAVITGGNGASNVYTGGLAAYVSYSYTYESYVRNCHNSAEIFGGDAPIDPNSRTESYKSIGGLFGEAIDIKEISNCSNSGKVNSKVLHLKSYYYPTNYVGGLIGYNSSGIYDCNNSGDVYVERNGAVGGIAGSSGARAFKVTRTVNTGNITLTDCITFSEIGGIAGNTGGEEISECVNKGELKASESATGQSASFISLGGIAGKSLGGKFDSATNTLPPSILNCTNEGKIELLTPIQYTVYCGGILGWQQNSNGNIKGCKNTADIISNNSKQGHVFTAGIVAVTYNTLVDNCVNSGSVTGGVALTSDPYRETTAVGGLVAMLSQGTVFNSSENAGIIKYNDSGFTKNLGSAVGYLEYDQQAGFISTLCTCTKDTSGQGLPMIGGGHTEMTEYTSCPAH